jgi:ankyrin repeat protein
MVRGGSRAWLRMLAAAAVALTLVACVSRPCSNRALLWAAGNHHYLLARVALIRADPGVRASDGTQGTALHRAAESGDLRLVSLLLASGVAVDVRDGAAQTALHCAASHGHLAVVQKLVARGAQVAARMQYGGTPLDLAAFGGHNDVARWLQDRGAMADFTCLAALGDKAAVLKAIEHGVDVNAPNTHGTSALYWAVHRRDPGLVRLLLKHGADPNTGDAFYGIPLLSWAALSDDADVVRALLDGGARANSQSNFWGATALHSAAARGREDVVRVLLEGGADASIRDYVGGTAADWAVSYGHPEIVGMLTPSQRGR